MAIFGKAIKPAVLKDKAMRAEILKANREVGEKIRQDFQKTTAAWNGSKPRMVSEITLKKDQQVLYVGPADAGTQGDKKWNWLDRGTRGPYPIYPGIVTGKSDKRALKFRTSFTAKTTVGVIGSRAGGSSGPFAYAKAVMHPGIKARRWTQKITQKWMKPYARALQDGLNNAVKVSGHAYKR